MIVSGLNMVIFPLYSGLETTPGVQCPGLCSPAQERYGATGMGPVTGYEDDERAGTPLMRKG